MSLSRCSKLCFARLYSQVGLKQSKSFYSQQSDQKTEKPKTFANLLRNSAFVGLGKLNNKRVQGTIFKVYENDVFVDFGGKFHCVCPIPELDHEKYIVGSKVVVNLKKFELSTRFLGSAVETTLLEADCVMLYPMGQYDANITSRITN